jgi:hypothetical protein
VRKHWLWFVLGAVALIIAGAAWLLRDQFVFANIATGYAAKQTCSCMYVTGRTLESCLADLPDGAGDRISVAADGENVRASVLFGAFSARAGYDPEYGCQLLD